jgi:hypothetical protein
VGLKDHAIFFGAILRTGISQNSFKGMRFCRNHGMMELWNDGIMGFQRKLSIFNLYRRVKFYQLPNIPAFHHSTIPIGAKSLTY